MLMNSITPKQGLGVNMKTPNFIVNQTVEVANKSKENRVTLKAGTFIRPISKDYVPKHILPNDDDGIFAHKLDESVETYAYAREGIVIIAWKYIDEV